MRTRVALLLVAVVVSGCTHGGVSAAARAVPLDPHPTRLQRLQALQEAAGLAPLPVGSAPLVGPGWPAPGALGRVLERDALPVVDAALDDPDPLVRRKAIELLNQISLQPGVRHAKLHDPWRRAMVHVDAWHESRMLGVLAMMHPPGRVSLDWLEAYVRRRVEFSTVSVARQLVLHGAEGRALIEGIRDDPASSAALRLHAVEIIERLDQLTAVPTGGDRTWP